MTVLPKNRAMGNHAMRIPFRRGHTSLLKHVIGRHKAGNSVFKTDVRSLKDSFDQESCLARNSSGFFLVTIFDKMRSLSQYLQQQCLFAFFVATQVVVESVLGYHESPNTDFTPKLFWLRDMKIHIYTV